MRTPSAAAVIAATIIAANNAALAPHERRAYGVKLLEREAQREERDAAALARAEAKRARRKARNLKIAEGAR